MDKFRFCNKHKTPYGEGGHCPSCSKEKLMENRVNCPVCGDFVLIENNKIGKHDYNSEVCYGSFMPPPYPLDGRVYLSKDGAPWRRTWEDGPRGRWSQWEEPHRNDDGFPAGLAFNNDEDEHPPEQPLDRTQQIKFPSCNPHYEDERTTSPRNNRKRKSR